MRMHDLLAAGVKAARQAKGWTQEDAARTFRFYGLTTWRTGTVGQMEAGLRRPRLDEILLICAALKVSLEQLIPDTGELVELGDGAVMTVPAIRAVLAGNYDKFLEQSFETLPHVRFPGELVAIRPLSDSWPESRRVRELLAPIAEHTGIAHFTSKDWDEAIARAPVDAERHAAKRLSVEVPQVIFASRALWGHDFTDERDTRVGDVGDAAPETLQARRGHATRAMLADLRAFLGEVYAGRGEEGDGER